MSFTDDQGLDDATAAFLSHRNLLFTVAYEMLGSAADAEDVVQETWLRWMKLDPEHIVDPRAFLVRIATRLALDRLRTLKRRQESYVGPWLPEPLLTTPDIAEDVLLAESVSMAMLLILETLTPTERAVFVLHEVFRFSHSEISIAVGRSTHAVKQISYRARGHVHARRPRHQVTPNQVHAAVTALQLAFTTGDFQPLADVLAPGVVLLTDGGGLARAALHPITGANKVMRYIAGGLRKHDVQLEADPTEINGEPALLLRIGDQIDGVLVLRVTDALVTHLYYVRNPAKLTQVGITTTLTRR